MERSQQTLRPRADLGLRVWPGTGAHPLVPRQVARDTPTPRMNPEQPAPPWSWGSCWPWGGPKGGTVLRGSLRWLSDCFFQVAVRGLCPARPSALWASRTHRLSCIGCCIGHKILSGPRSSPGSGVGRPTSPLHHSTLIRSSKGRLLCKEAHTPEVQGGVFTSLFGGMLAGDGACLNSGEASTNGSSAGHLVVPGASVHPGHLSPNP